MELEGSLMRSQVPANCSFPELARFSACAEKIKIFQKPTNIIAGF
jgi:hypothetical protein